MRQCTRYIPVMIEGTSGHDHLSYEVQERISAAGYASRGEGKKAWSQACRSADECRHAQGYARVSRPRCEIKEIKAIYDFVVDGSRTVSERWEAESYASHGHSVVERVRVDGNTYQIPVNQ